jgi:hypothetical protein
LLQRYAAPIDVQWSNSAPQGGVDVSIIVAFIDVRLVMRERSLTRLSRSRLGRLAASSSIVGITTIPQCPRSPRNQPRNTRINIAASRRSVFPLAIA